MKRWKIILVIVIALIVVVFAGKLLYKHFITDQIKDKDGMENPQVGNAMQKPEIISLCISYSGGMQIENNYSYSVSKDSSGYHLYASLNSGNKEISEMISQADYEALVRPFDYVDLASWSNNKDEPSDMIALDAAVFSFSAQFGDATSCSAKSLAYAPDGYAEAADAFEARFRSLAGISK